MPECGSTERVGFSILSATHTDNNVCAQLSTVSAVGDTAPMPSSDLATMRLVAQGLAKPQASTPEQVVAHLGAVQAQDLPGAITSVALRMAKPSTSQVIAAMNAGRIVRSWPMRGTLHLMLPSDLDAITKVTAPRMLAESAGRRRQLGISDADLDEATQLALEALPDGATLSRSELFALWQQHGLSDNSSSATHVLRVLCQQRVLVLGPMNGKDQRIVSYRQWIAPSGLDSVQARAHLAESYFTSHGPATVADFSRWSGLTRSDSRAAVAQLSEQMVPVDENGSAQFMRADLPERLTELRHHTDAVILLPGFDEFILGYADRSFAIDPDHANRIVPGNNGMFKATIVHRGRVIGLWKRAGSAAKPRLETTWFTAPDADLERRAQEAFEVLPRPFN